MTHSACQNCEWRGPDTDLREVKDLTQRVDPGEPMPSGECPECGALCQPISVRLEYLRGELRAERISMGELHELQGLTAHIEPGDVELLEAAGVPESTQRVRVRTDCQADVREVWEGNAPGHLDGDDLREWCDESLRTGSELTFETQEVDGEHNRQIADIEVLADDAPASDASNASADLDYLRDEIKGALEGDSNDAEHDALVSVAEHFGIRWEPADV